MDWSESAGGRTGAWLGPSALPLALLLVALPPSPRPLDGFHHIVLHAEDASIARILPLPVEGTHLVNDGGDVWVLGYKTERGGTLVDTHSQGRSEILGGFSYTTGGGTLAPMFLTVHGSTFAFFAEVCHNNDPYGTLIWESRWAQKSKTVKRGEGGTWPYIGWQKPR